MLPNYFYILLTVILTIYGQIIIKWQMNSIKNLPTAVGSKLLFLCGQFFNPWIISVFIAAAIAALSWMVAMTKMELSVAYPWVSLSFAGVLVASGVLFHETIGVYKVLGVLFIMSGVIIGSYGK